MPFGNQEIYGIVLGTPGGGGGGGSLVVRGAHMLVIKIKKYPISTDFWPKKHPYFDKNADFFQ